ncbi:DNA primase [Streptomyces bungoensis]|uniref:DNA primase n=1 Tax=Streptomyces bungoensis TaxID=285568 RepID=UPI00343E64CF
MNRTALGLAVGAGYLLGRTKKLKMAMAVGSLVAGKKLNLTPKALAGMVQQQLRDNPQFKEIGDQLRGELRGVGKAASGAMVERQMSVLADRLHSRTNRVRDQISGGSGEAEGSEEEHGGEEPRDEEEREDGDREDTGREEEPPRKKAAKKAPPKKALAKKAAAKAPAKKAAARKTGSPGRPAAKKTGAAGGARGGRPEQPKGGDDR